MFNITTAQRLSLKRVAVSSSEDPLQWSGCLGRESAAEPRVFGLSLCCTELLTWVIVSAGHDLRSGLSFSAKQRSALPQEAPNKDREMETHRNSSLCSHDLIRHGGAELSGSGAACCTDGKPKSNLRGDGESARIMLLSGAAARLRRHIDSGAGKSGVVSAIYCESLI